MRKVMHCAYCLCMQLVRTLCNPVQALPEGTIIDAVFVVVLVATLTGITKESPHDISSELRTEQQAFIVSEYLSV